MRTQACKSFERTEECDSRTERGGVRDRVRRQVCRTQQFHGPGDLGLLQVARRGDSDLGVKTPAEGHPIEADRHCQLVDVRRGLTLEAIAQIFIRGAFQFHGRV